MAGEWCLVEQVALQKGEFGFDGRFVRVHEGRVVPSRQVDQLCLRRSSRRVDGRPGRADRSWSHTTTSRGHRALDA